MPGEHRLDLYSFARDVTGVRNHEIAFVQTARDLKTVAIIAADLDFLKVDRAVPVRLPPSCLRRGLPERRWGSAAAGSSAR